MRRAKKLVSVAGIVAIAAVSLSGCGALGGNPNELKFWNPLTGDDGSYMRQIVEDYNATDPEYPVKFQPIAADDMYPKVYSVASTGKDLPDIMLVHGPRVAELAKAEVIEPIDNLTKDQPELKRDNYLDEAWDAQVVDDKTYGVPLDLHGTITYYNKDLVKKYGAESILDDDVVTVDELESLKGKLPKGTYAVTGGFLPPVIQTMQYNLGGDLGDADSEIDMTGANFAKTYDALVQLREAGLMNPEDDDSLRLFNGGKALFLPDGTWGYQGHAKVEGLNFGLTNSIQMSDKNPVNLLESHAFVQMADENRDPERTQGVADFLEYVRTNSIGWAEAGQVVASREIYDSADYATYPQAFLTATPEQQAMLKTDNYIYSPYAMSGLWEGTSDIVYGRKDVAKGLKDMQLKVSGLIAEAKKS